MYRARKVLLLLTSALMIYMASPVASAMEQHPALAIMSRYKNDLPRMDFFEPATILFLVLNDLENNREFTAAGNFLRWYLDNLNYPDKHGLTGTIYDYVVIGDEVRATRKYNSIGATPGLFLHVVHKYVTVTNDKFLIDDNWAKLNDIVYTIIYLQNKKSGLVRMLPNLDREMLLDNCLAYLGFKAYNELCSLMDKKKVALYESAEKHLYKILSESYDENYQTFNWLFDDGEDHQAIWEKYYPDSVSQLFALYAGLRADEPEITNHLWEKFTAHHAGDMANKRVEHRIIYELTKKRLNK